MEGRWINLATRAQRQGALDYSEVTRDVPESLLKERWILWDFEREANSKSLEFGMSRLTALAPYLKPDIVFEQADLLAKAHNLSVNPWQSVYIDRNKKRKRQVNLKDPKEVEEYYNTVIAHVRRVYKKDKQVDG